MADNVDGGAPDAAVRDAAVDGDGDAGLDGGQPHQPAPVAVSYLPWCHPDLVPPVGAFHGIAAGSTGSCALDSEGKARCWGPLQAPPDLPFTKVAVGTTLGRSNLLLEPTEMELPNGHGLTEEGELVGWGMNAEPYRLRPGLEGEAGDFVSVCHGNMFSCTLDAVGQVDCWGWGARHANMTPPAVELHELVCGLSFACALDETSKPICWGAPEVAGMAPDLALTSLHAGESGACGLQADGSVACWGDMEPPAGHYKLFGYAGYRTCGLSDQDQLKCWRRNGTEELVSEGQYTSLYVGQYEVCAEREDTQLVCWYVFQNYEPVEHELPTGPLETVSLVQDGGCAVKQDGSQVCWGSAATLPSGLPSSARALALDDAAGCIISAEGSLHCWGYEEEGASDWRVPEGTFLDFDLGYQQGCAIDTTHAITCWGPLAATPPSGEFAQVSVGNSYACAVEASSGLVTCWGSGGGAAEPPTTPLKLIDVWDAISCGIDLENNVRCWGSPEAAPPPGLQASLVKASSDRACAITLESQVVCWGKTPGEPPQGTFVDLALGSRHGCAIGADGAISCWGYEESSFLRGEVELHFFLIEGGTCRAPSGCSWEHWEDISRDPEIEDCPGFHLIQHAPSCSAPPAPQPWIQLTPGTHALVVLGMFRNWSDLDSYLMPRTCQEVVIDGTTLDLRALYPAEAFRGSP